MKTTIHCAVSFAIGGISGFLLADHILKEKYEKRVEEEVESVKSSLRKYRTDPKEEASEADDEAVKQ